MAKRKGKGCVGGITEWRKENTGEWKIEDGGENDVDGGSHDQESMEKAALRKGNREQKKKKKGMRE